MSDVPFRLTVSRDPKAKGVIRQWERDLVNSDKKYNETRVRQRRKSETDVNRIRGLALQQEIRAQKAAEASGRASLQRRLAAFKKEKEGEVRAARVAGEKIRREESRRGRRDVVPGNPLGGVGGMGGSAAGGLIGRLGVGAAARIGGPLALAYGAYRIGSSGVNNYSAEQARIARLGSMVGGEKAARGINQEMKGLSAASGADVGGLIEAVQMMVNFGVETKSAVKKVKQMVAISGGDIQRVSALARGFGQASSMGRLQAEERNQLIDAGFNPMSEIAKATGMAMGELTDKMRKGEVSADLLSDAFDAATEAGGKFGGAMDAMEGTTKQTMASFSQSWKNMTIDIGRRLDPLVTNLASAGASILNTTVRMGHVIEARDSPEAYDRAVAAATANNLDAARYHMARGANSETTYLDEGHEVQVAMKSLELDEKLAAVQAKRAKELKAAAAQREREEQEELARARRVVAERGKLVTNALEVNKIRKAGAASDLKASQKQLTAQQKLTAEARGALMSSREKFGSMSSEDQRSLIQTMLKGRQDVRSLGVEDIAKLQSFGSVESEKLARQAALFRSRGAFGSTAQQRLADNNAQDFGARNAQGRLTRGANFQYDKDGNQLDQRKFSRDELRRQELLANQRNHLKQEARGIRRTDQQRTAIRESLFDGERQAVRRQAQRQTRIEADVKHDIEFIAKFDKSAEQIAGQVTGLMQKAVNERMDAVVKQLKPAMKFIEDQRRKNMALNPGRGRSGGR